MNQIVLPVKKTKQNLYLCDKYNTGKAFYELYKNPSPQKKQLFNLFVNTYTENMRGTPCCWGNSFSVTFACLAIEQGKMFLVVEQITRTRKIEVVYAD